MTIPFSRSYGAALPLMLVGLLAGCERDAAPPAPNEDVLEVSGAVTYRERIMLPTEATVGVTLRDAAGDRVADTTFVADQQPPIPFTLRVPRAVIETAHAYSLTARLSAEDGNLVWGTSEAIPVLTRGAPDVVEIVLVSERRPQAPLTDPWRQARERGVSFRAIGQEPTWMLDMYGRVRTPQRLVLSVDDEGASFDFGPIIRDEDGDGNPRYRASGDETRIEVVVEDRLCVDVISGEEFEAEVSIRLNGRVLLGCGRELF